MKYYIQFPIPLNCNLHCPYCFHMDYFKSDKDDSRWHKKRSFSLEEYRQWRETFLTDAEDIIMHLHGGEPFCEQNINITLETIDFMDKEKIDLLSNGIYVDYSRLLKYKEKIYRIGFTFHRSVISGKDELVERFKENVFYLRDNGFNVYVKELLVPEERDSIVENKKYWESNGIQFRIQDFRGAGVGKSKEVYSRYAPIDHLLVSQEYKHRGNECSCRDGYKGIIIRGYDMKNVWEKGGDVIACWHDPTVVGNIKEMWFKPNYRILKKKSGRFSRDVVGVDKLYRGTNERDVLPKDNLK